MVSYLKMLLIFFQMSGIKKLFKTPENPFIIRNSFTKNTQIKHTVYHELRNNISMPKRDFVVQKAIDDIKNGKKNIYCKQ